MHSKLNFVLVLVVLLNFAQVFTKDLYDSRERNKGQWNFFPINSLNIPESHIL